MKQGNKRIKRYPKKKAIKARKRILKPIIFFTALFISISFVILIVFKALDRFISGLSYFEIKEISIKGARQIPEREILNLFGIRLHEGIFASDITRGAQRIKNHPWVEQVCVYRTLPQKLNVVVKERRPIALLLLDDFYLLDEHGKIIKKAEASSDFMDIPVFTGIDSYYLRNKPKETYDLLSRGIGLLELLKDRKGFVPSEVFFHSSEGLTLFLSDNPYPIKIGFDDFQEKLLNFEKVRLDLKRRGLSPLYVDLRYKTKIFIKTQRQKRGLT